MPFATYMSQLELELRVPKILTTSFAGRVWLPAATLRRFQRPAIRSSRPPCLGFAWRNTTFGYFSRVYLCMS